jgi:hypothetical protein
VEDLKTAYKDMLKKYHPDTAPNELKAKCEIVTKSIVTEFQNYANYILRQSHTEFKKSDPDEAENPTDLVPFETALNEALKLDCTLELIGSWIYASKSYACRDELKKLGFWFSTKHRTWVFSGTRKACFKSAKKYTLEVLRIKHGNKLLKTKTEEEETVTS